MQTIPPTVLLQLRKGESRCIKMFACVTIYACDVSHVLVDICMCLAGVTACLVYLRRVPYMAVQEVYGSTLACQMVLTWRCVFWSKWLNRTPWGGMTTGRTGTDP